VPAIGIDSIGPHALRDRGDRGSLLAGDRPPHRELAAHRTVALASDVREELAGAAGGIGADQDRGAVPVGIGQLRECGVEHRDVVGGGVAARVAPSQHGGEELAGVVAERQHRVEPERLLERRSSLLLLAVADHDRSVEVNHQPGQLTPARSRGRERLARQLGALRPDDLTRHRSSPRDRAQPGGVEPVKQPPARRVGRHRPEQRSLIRQHRNIRDRRRAVSDRDRHVHQHPARIMPRPRLAQAGQHLAQLRRERGPVSDIGEQSGAGVRHHALAVRRGGDPRPGRCNLHLESAQCYTRELPTP
jgi:hypothetical protein